MSTLQWIVLLTVLGWLTVAIVAALILAAIGAPA